MKKRCGQGIINLHIKPFEIEEYLVDKFKECSSCSNEFGCIYKFNKSK